MLSYVYSFVQYLLARLLTIRFSKLIFQKDEFFFFFCFLSFLVFIWWILKLKGFRIYCVVWGNQYIQGIFGIGSLWIYLLFDDKQSGLNFTDPVTHQLFVSSLFLFHIASFSGYFFFNLLRYHRHWHCLAFRVSCIFMYPHVRERKINLI